MAVFTYSQVDDLLLGDITLGARANADKYVIDATEEINSCLGYRYELPLPWGDEVPTPNPAPIPNYSKLLLKRCANLIASGRMIMALAVGGEDLSTHAYGNSLLTEGHLMMESLCNGNTDIPNAVIIDVVVSGIDRGPSIQQQDATSGVDAFYTFVGPSTFVTSDPWQSGTMAR